MLDFFGQIIATSHDLTPNGGLVREIPLFQGNLGWWNIIIWPDFWRLCSPLKGAPIPPRDSPDLKKKRLKRSKHPEAWQRRVLDGGFFALKLFRIIFQFWCFRILRYCLKDPRWNSSTFEHSSKIVVGCFIFEDYTAHSYWHGFFSQSKDPIMNRSQYFMECPRSGFCFRCSLTLPFRELTYPPKIAFWRWFSFSQGGKC